MKMKRKLTKPKIAGLIMLVIVCFGCVVTISLNSCSTTLSASELEFQSDLGIKGIKE